MRSLLAVAVAVTAFACSKVDNQNPRAGDQGTAMADNAGRGQPAATAALSPLGTSGVNGELAFFPTDGGVRVEGYVKGLAPNTTHGFHVHEHGDCSAPDGSSAGNHYNPTSHPHGAPGPESHLGDMGNIVSDADGRATVSAFLTGANVGGAQEGVNVVGHAVIVHAQTDDLATQPTGNSGGRVACGVVTKQ